MPRNSSSSSSSSCSDYEESVEISSRQSDKFGERTHNRVMEDPEEGELRLPDDPQHVEDGVTNDDGQNENEGDEKEPKRAK